MIFIYSMRAMEVLLPTNFDLIANSTLQHKVCTRVIDFHFDPRKKQVTRENTASFAAGS